jgi:hypothetical protein
VAGIPSDGARTPFSFHGRYCLHSVDGLVSLSSTRITSGKSHVNARIFSPWSAGTLVPIRPWLIGKRSPGSFRTTDADA